MNTEEWCRFESGLHVQILKRNVKEMNGQGNCKNQYTLRFLTSLTTSACNNWPMHKEFNLYIPSTLFFSSRSEAILTPKCMMKKYMLIDSIGWEKQVNNEF